MTCFFTEILTCSSDFKSLSIVIPRSISFVFDSMEEPSISAVDGSLQKNVTLATVSFHKVVIEPCEKWQ